MELFPNSTVIDHNGKVIRVGAHIAEVGIEVTYDSDTGGFLIIASENTKIEDIENARRLFPSAPIFQIGKNEIFLSLNDVDNSKFAKQIEALKAKYPNKQVVYRTGFIGDSALENATMGMGSITQEKVNAICKKYGLSMQELIRITQSKKDTLSPLECQITEEFYMSVVGDVLDDENLEFRYCSKCNGNYEYCQDHLFTHEHVK